MINHPLKTDFFFSNQDSDEFQELLYCTATHFPLVYLPCYHNTPYIDRGIAKIKKTGIIGYFGLERISRGLYSNALIKAWSALRTDQLSQGFIQSGFKKSLVTETSQFLCIENRSQDLLFSFFFSIPRSEGRMGTIRLCIAQALSKRQSTC